MERSSCGHVAGFLQAERCIPKRSCQRLPMRRQRPPVHPGCFAFQRLSLASVCLRRRSGGNVVREVSYAGTEHIGPEDTFDADYGRLLEAVQNRGKRLASQRDSNERENTILFSSLLNRCRYLYHVHTHMPPPTMARSLLTPLYVKTRVQAASVPCWCMRKPVITR